MAKTKTIYTPTTTDKILKPIHEFYTWLSGDPTSPTYETRKTFFEGILVIFGTIFTTQIAKKLDIL